MGLQVQHLRQDPDRPSHLREHREVHQHQQHQHPLPRGRGGARGRHRLSARRRSGRERVVQLLPQHRTLLRALPHHPHRHAQLRALRRLRPHRRHRHGVGRRGAERVPQAERHRQGKPGRQLQGRWRRHPLLRPLQRPTRPALPDGRAHRSLAVRPAAPRGHAPAGGDPARAEQGQGGARAAPVRRGRRHHHAGVRGDALAVGHRQRGAPTGAPQERVHAPQLQPYPSPPRGEAACVRRVRRARPLRRAGTAASRSCATTPTQSSTSSATAATGRSGRRPTSSTR